MVVTGIDLAAARAPDGMRLYAIGDVHGRLDLLERMHARIRAEIAASRPADWRIVHVGDYVDRGPQSKGVIDFLIDATRTDPRHVALGGNHDAAMLEFLRGADTDGLFARFGGRETALSYGVDADFASPALARRTADALLAAMPPAHVDFLERLPLSVSFGDFFFCHAGIRPGLPLERQDPNDLIWIRDVFLNDPRLHPKVIVHGHTPAPQAQVLANRVNVDTGAFRSNRLTALVVDCAAKRTIEVGI